MPGKEQQYLGFSSKSREISTTLTDRAKQVQIPVKQGGAVRAMQIHPTAPQYLVVAQLNSDKFMAVVPIKDSSFIEVLLPKYESFHGNGKQVSIPANFKAGASANDSSSMSNSNSNREPVWRIKSTFANNCQRHSHKSAET